MFSGFLASAFVFLLKFGPTILCITVRLSDGRFLFIFPRTVKNFVFRDNLVGSKVGGMKTTFFAIFI